jgi:hypothetical protein
MVWIRVVVGIHWGGRPFIITGVCTIGFMFLFVVILECVGKKFLSTKRLGMRESADAVICIFCRVTACGITRKCCMVRASTPSWYLMKGGDPHTYFFVRALGMLLLTCKLVKPLCICPSMTSTIANSSSMLQPSGIGKFTAVALEVMLMPLCF